MNKGQNIYIFLLLKFLLALGLLLLSQLFFYLFNTRIFHLDGIGEFLGVCWGNIRFGIATLAIVLFPYLLLNILPFKFRWKKSFRILSETFLYYIPVIAVLVPNGIDTEYFQFTYHRMTSDMFNYMGVGGDMGNLIPLFIRDYWKAILAFAVLMLVFYWGGKRIHLRERGRFDHNRRRDLYGMAFCLLVLVVAVRGGFQRHFLQLTDAAHHCQPKNSALVINSGYTIIRTIGTKELPEIENPVANPEVYVTSQHIPAVDTLVSIDTLPKRNVVLLVLESFSQEYIGCYNRDLDASFTPFLDSLSRYCTLYQGRSNGKKSIESIPAILASMPTLMESPYLMSPYCPDSVFSLAWLLRGYGYGATFFHGSYNGVLDFDKFCYKAGVEKYYGMDEYVEDHVGDSIFYDGAWGIGDEPFLQYTAEQLASFSQPFFTTIFTISSHHPYAIPEEHKGEFRQGKHPLLQSVGYTDYALRRFFDTISTQPWFSNTIFIITGDHPGQGLSREYNDYDGWYRVPMMVYTPYAPVHRDSPRIFQQMDIMPTVADLLHLPDTFACLGSSAVQHPYVGRQVVYGSDYYMLVSNVPTAPEEHSIALLSGDREEGALDDINRLKATLQLYFARLEGDKKYPQE